MHIIDQRRTFVPRRFADHSRDLRISDRTTSTLAGERYQRLAFCSSIGAVRAGARVCKNERAHHGAMAPPERERDVTTHRKSRDDCAIDPETLEQESDVVRKLIDGEWPVRGALAEST